MNFEGFKEEQSKYNKEPEQQLKLQKRQGSTKRYIFIILGTILAYTAGRMLLWLGASTPLIIIETIGVWLVIHGSYFWAREKGRNGWWCLTGLLAPIGFLILYKLKANKEKD